MKGLRTLVDEAVAAAIAEHPKYFTERGLEHARAAIVRKVMAAFRGGDGERAPGDASPETPAPPAAPPEPPAPTTPRPVTTDCAEGRAYLNLRKLAGAGDPFRMGDGRISLPPECANAAVLAFAELPKREAWGFLTALGQVGAWTSFFRDTLTTTPRRPIIETRNGQAGIFVPWPWPPSKTGKVYSFESEAAPE